MPLARPSVERGSSGKRQRPWTIDRPIGERIQAIDAFGVIDCARGDRDARRVARAAGPRARAAGRAAGPERAIGPEVVGVISDAWRGLTPALQASAVEVALGRGGPTSARCWSKLAAGKLPPAAFDPRRGPSCSNSPDAAVAAAAKAALQHGLRKSSIRMLFEQHQGGPRTQG